MKNYHYFYKITNIINGHYYYGVHNTNNLEDGYMGSGKYLLNAYKKYGKENFKKEILKFFDSSEEAFIYESKIVSKELVKDPNCYNVQQGGKTFNTENLIPVIDKNGEKFLIRNDDPRWLSQEVISIHKGKISVIGEDGKIYRTLVTDPKYISGNLKHPNKGKCHISLIDENGKTYIIHSKLDPLYQKYLNGELHGTFYGHTHKKESINKMKNTFSKINHQKGSKNSQFGTCWINNGSTSIKIKKDKLEEYLNNGWKTGRKMMLE